MRNRRKLITLSGITAVAGIAAWNTPVIRHVILPVHAMTSGVDVVAEETVDPAVPTLSPEDIIRNIIEPLVLSKSPHD